mgnify:CR=1 FL=1
MFLTAEFLHFGVVVNRYNLVSYLGLNPIQQLQKDLQIVLLPPSDQLPHKVIQSEPTSLFLCLLVFEVDGLYYIRTILV